MVCSVGRWEVRQGDVVKDGLAQSLTILKTEGQVGSKNNYSRVLINIYKYSYTLGLCEYSRTYKYSRVLPQVH